VAKDLGKDGLMILNLCGDVLGGDGVDVRTCSLRRSRGVLAGMGVALRSLVMTRGKPQPIISIAIVFSRRAEAFGRGAGRYAAAAINLRCVNGIDRSRKKSTAGISEHGEADPCADYLSLAPRGRGYCRRRA
jgi:hypothetical protein